MNHWLFKSEPDTYGIDDLATEKDGIDVWDGIRNLLRDKVANGDQLFFITAVVSN